MIKDKTKKHKLRKRGGMQASFLNIIIIIHEKM